MDDDDHRPTQEPGGPQDHATHQDHATPQDHATHQDHATPQGHATPQDPGATHEHQAESTQEPEGRWGRLKEGLRSVPPRYPGAFVLYLVVAAILVHDWDGFVFRTAVSQLFQGVSPYQIASDPPFYTFLGITDTHPQWYAYPPLFLLLMAFTSTPLLLFEAAPFFERVLIKMPVILGGLALAAVGEAWVRRLTGNLHHARIAGRLLLFHPFFVLAGPAWGMSDGLLMALFLGGLLLYDQGRSASAGLAVSAAVLIKPFPVLLLVPLVPVLLARKGWRPVGPFVVAGSLFAVAVVLPFLLRSPQGFWTQAVGNHLARDVQGYSLWALWPLQELSFHVVSSLSFVLIALGFLAIVLLARRRGSPQDVLLVASTAAAVVLLFNRVVNEQYLVMVTAPLVILLVAGAFSSKGRWVVHWTLGLSAAAVFFTGFHFITFFPPDVSLLLFGRPVDAVAHDVRQWAPGLWVALHAFFAVMVPMTMVAVAMLTVRTGSLRGFEISDSVRRFHQAPAAFACFVLVLFALPGFLAPVVTEDVPFEPAHEQDRVAAFYYIWWHNPAHDPDILYGNWFPVSQHPQMGYYTNQRGVHRDHAQMMVHNGIDTAIVSYHRGNLDRYTVFQEEASRVGLQVTPLIELNQVYDQSPHRPVNEQGEMVPYAAYRLDPGTREAMAGFVLDLEALLMDSAALRIDGRPVIYFYDAYVSGLSFYEEDKLSLAEVLLDMYSIEELRGFFNDTTLEGDPVDLLRHHPTRYTQFFEPGAHRSVWREAHLEQHARFWTALRADIEQVLGPVFMISGEAYNERAGIEAGTVKSMANLDLFDGSFLYSPSFPWGDEPGASFWVNFARWEDRNHWLVALSAAQGHYTSTGIAPAYDDTVNRPHGFVIPAEYDGHDFYDLSWRSVFRHPTDQAAVATFNEWFEGSSIEPNIEYGDRHLLATPGYRETFLHLDSPGSSVVHIIHERSSRTHPAYDELDDSHTWGLRMVTAAMRADAGHRHLALDGLAHRSMIKEAPAVILAEGGRPPFEISPYVHERMDAWLDQGVPFVLFGPDAAGDLWNKLPVDCPVPERPDPWFLTPGDVLVAGEGSVVLEREDGRYVVGLRCGSSAYVLFKPWAEEMIPTDGRGIGDLSVGPETEAQCLATILLALAPEAAPGGARSECRVP